MSATNNTSTPTLSQAEKSRAFSYRFYKARAKHWEEEAAKYAVLGMSAQAKWCENRHEMFADLACEFAPLPQLTREFAAQLPPWQEQARMAEANRE